MKNQYFGDKKDYHKYGLLRALVQSSGYSPLVAWMRTPDDSSTHGQDVIYFDEPEKWAIHDPELYAALHHLLVRRNIRKLSALKHLPMFTEFEFFGRVLPPGCQERSDWFDRLMKRSRRHDLVFFDPDNGLEIESVPRGRKQSDRYLFYDELSPFVAIDRVLLIYQHYPHERRPAFEARVASNLRERCQLEHITVFRTPEVGFFAGYSAAERGRVEVGLAAVKASWGDRFKIIDL